MVSQQKVESMLGNLERYRAILPGDMAPVLAQMARFRNRLVHLYWQVDDIAVYNILHRDLGDFDRFTSHIRKFISQEEEDSEP